MVRMMITVVALALVMPFGAFAVTGSGESGTIPLETMSPTLNLVSPVTERDLSATFSEPMLWPGITAPGNYAVSDVGKGTLNASPDAVGGSGPYTLMWIEGEMRNAAPVTVTATGVQDTAGNPINPAGNSISCTGLGIGPTFALSANPSQAGVGQVVTIKLRVSEPLDTDPIVKINGNDAIYVSGGAGADYIFDYVVQATDPLGGALVSVTGFDLAGHTGTFETLEIVDNDPEPAVPLRAWPVGTALLAAGLLVLAWRRRRAGVLLLLLMAAIVAQASLPAFAQTPEVSNVTYTQSPNGTTSTKVDITYDLVSPNGPCDITVSLSKDGVGFSDPVTSITGDIAGVTTGTGKHIVWDIRADYPEEDIPNARIRVTADDGFALHTLTYTADENGSISGATPQSVIHGYNGTAVTAVPNAHYHFVQWSDLSAQNPRTDTNVTVDITVTAEFGIDTYTIDCDQMGEGFCMANPFIVDYGATSDIVVWPNFGWHIVDVQDSVEGTKTGSYTTTPITANRSVMAVFMFNMYNITCNVVGSGTCSANPPVVMHGAPSNITVTPAAHWHIVSVMDSAEGPKPGSYMTGPVLFGRTVTATFGIDTYTLTYAAGANGSISGTTPQTVNYGADGTAVTAVPDSGYVFSEWSDASTQNPRTDTNVTADITVTASFIRAILLPGDVPLELVWVPSGSFQMGRYPGEADSDTREDPQHAVTLSYGFWMGKYEITQQQWIAVRSTWPGTAPSASNGLGPSYPAYDISWDDTKNFITTLNAYIISSGQGPLTVRLPSEAEWEYACRAGTQTRFYFGDSLGCDGLCTDCAAGVLPGNRSAYMWYCGNNSPNGSKAVGGKTPNAFGLYDMSGNVWEWCEDDYHASYTGAPTNGTAWIDSPTRASTRMFRGGGWDPYAGNCRSADRSNGPPGIRDYGIGFRVAAVQ